MSKYERQYMCEDIRKASGVPVSLKNVFMLNLEPRNHEQAELMAKLDTFLHQKRDASNFAWSLVVIGTVGNGKTTLVGSAVNWWNDRYWFYEHPALYTTQNQLIIRFRDTFESKTESEWTVFSRYANADVVVIDELNANDWSEYTKATIQKILVERHANRRLTILIGNVGAKAFAGMFDAHVRSRLREGITQVMTADDMRTAPDGIV